MLGIDAWAEPRGFVRRYLHYDPYPYPILIDTSQRVADTYGMWKTPESVFIGRSGKITAVYPGAIPSKTLSRDIELILRSPSSGKASA